MTENTKNKTLHKTQKFANVSRFQITSSDYKKEFLYPDKGFSFHFCDNWTGYMHNHNYYEFFIVTKGKLTHIINDKSEELSCRTIYFITPSDKHIILPLKGYESQHINIAVTPERLKLICDSVNEQIFPLLIAKNFHFSLDESDFSSFINKSDKLSILYSKTDDRTVNQLYILEMLTNAISCTYQKLLHLNLSLPDWFNDLLDEINKMNFSELTINNIYKKANYSPAALVKYFKEYLGKTIVAYVADLKVERACALLTNTNYQIITIAYMSGFETLQHFNRTFKQKTGQTPKEYRQQNNK
ncbi:MAG: AraC family transcriptional regulator [Clostridia bacterium]|nr:AraC family transcriptional regulator [Clostridia bacterium]